MSIEYLNKINGNPGFVDGATIPPFASKAALDASGSGWEIGTIANAAGVPYSWRGAGVGWNPSSCGPIYNGTTLPFPTGGDCLRIRAINPAVPKGWSWLEWNGTIWAPPAGEVVFSNMQTNELMSVTGLTAGTRVAIGSYLMPPAYMWPEYKQMWLRAAFGSSDQSSTANQSFGITITSETLPSSPDFNDRIVAQAARGASQSYLSGIPGSVIRQFMRAWGFVTSFEIGNVNHLPGDVSAINGWPGRNSGTYAEGSTKIVLDVLPGATTNMFKFYGAEVIA